MILEELEWWEISLCYKLRDRSLFIALGGGGGFWGDHLIFRRTKGGISRNCRTQKGGSLKTLEGCRGRTTRISFENEDMGGSRKSSNVVRGVTSVK